MRYRLLLSSYRWFRRSGRPINPQLVSQSAPPLRSSRSPVQTEGIRNLIITEKVRSALYGPKDTPRSRLDNNAPLLLRQSCCLLKEKGPFVHSTPKDFIHYIPDARRYRARSACAYGRCIGRRTSKNMASS